MSYSFHPQVLEFFPDFEYRNPPPHIRERCDMRRSDNIVGHQQRAVTTWWAVRCCSPMDLGLDLGAAKGLTPFCIHVDVFGDGRPHPVYGGGAYLSDVVCDCADRSRLAIFPDNAFPYIGSNHSLEHMPASGDSGIVEVLVCWLSKLRQGGVLAMVVPNQDAIDVFASDPDHKHAWGASDFRARVLDHVVGRVSVEVLGYDTLQNHFSFDVVLKKR